MHNGYHPLCRFCNGEEGLVTRTSRTTAPRWQAWITALAVVCGLGLPAITAQPAEALSGSDFRAGNIISDALFFNGGVMTAPDVQAFLDARAGACKPGYTCLASYRQTTTNIAPVAGQCGGYTAVENETAASIIARVGASCGISQAVLLVLLQKEQGLVTATAPTAETYSRATGYGCPSTTCDPKYAGFFLQVYSAAQRFKYYVAHPTQYRAGSVVNVLFHPNAACGSAPVYIENFATAGLYSYTPYQPNAAALVNLSGTGDGCSSYGNRNFWRIYSTWFGSTSGGGAMVRTAEDPTVYVVTFDRKYPVADVDTLMTLGVLGSVSYVQPEFLASRPTGFTLGRFIRGRDGTIYLVDRGIRYPVASCSDLAAFGRDCNDFPGVVFPDTQVAAFTLGPPLSRTVQTASGRTFLIEAGTRREVTSVAALSAAGAPPAVQLGDGSIAALPYGRPVLDSTVVVSARSSGTRALVTGGAVFSFSSGVLDENVVGRTVNRVSVDEPSMATLGTPAAIGGVVRIPSGTRYALTQRGARPLAPTELADVPGTPVPSELVSALPALSSDPAGPLLVKTVGDPSIYIVQGGVRRFIPSMDVLGTLLPAGAPLDYVTLTLQESATLSTGSPVLPPGSVVKSVSAPDLFMVDGLGSLARIPSMLMFARFGQTSWATVSDSSLGGYATGLPLSSLVECSGVRGVMVDGKLMPVEGDRPGLTFRSLDSATCATLPRSPAHVVGPLFVKGPTSPTVYMLENGTKRAVSTMEAVAALSAPGGVQIAVLDDTELATFTDGPAVLAPGRVVKVESAPDLYLVDGAGSLARINSMDLLMRWGARSWSTVDQQTLGGYSLEAPLSTAISCGATRGVLVDGAFIAVEGDGLGLAYRSLEPSTCLLLAHTGLSLRGPLLVKAVGDPTVFAVSGGVRQPLSSWARLLEVNGGQPLVIVTMEASELSGMAVGPTL